MGAQKRRATRKSKPAVNGAAIFLKAGAGKFPKSGGLAISRGRDKLLDFLAAGHDASGSVEWDWRNANDGSNR